MSEAGELGANVAGNHSPIYFRASVLTITEPTLRDVCQFNICYYTMLCFISFDILKLTSPVLRAY